jgi:hypothetical protein
VPLFLAHEPILLSSNVAQVWLHRRTAQAAAIGGGRMGRIRRRSLAVLTVIYYNALCIHVIN